jgi:hypothetical protein
MRANTRGRGVRADRPPTSALRPLYPPGTGTGTPGRPRRPGRGPGTRSCPGRAAPGPRSAAPPRPGPGGCHCQCTALTVPLGPAPGGRPAHSHHPCQAGGDSLVARARARATGRPQSGTQPASRSQCAQWPDPRSQQACQRSPGPETRDVPRCQCQWTGTGRRIAKGAPWNLKAPEKEQMQTPALFGREAENARVDRSMEPRGLRL